MAHRWSKPCDTEAYISLSLYVQSYGMEGYQKNAGMGHHPDMAHASSMNYKEEKSMGWLWVVSKTSLCDLLQLVLHLR